MKWNEHRKVSKRIRLVASNAGRIQAALDTVQSPRMSRVWTAEELIKQARAIIVWADCVGVKRDSLKSVWLYLDSANGEDGGYGGGHSHYIGRTRATVTFNKRGERLLVSLDRVSFRKLDFIARVPGMEPAAIARGAMHLILAFNRRYSIANTLKGLI